MYSIDSLGWDGMGINSSGMHTRVPTTVSILVLNRDSIDRHYGPLCVLSKGRVYSDRP